MLQDLRYALRQIRKTPVFTAVAVATLALGIGANTTVFSAVDAVLLRPLPYYQPDRLVLVNETVMNSGNDYIGVAAQEYLDYRDQNQAFSNVAAFETAGFNLTGEGPPLRVQAASISASAFPTLRVSPIMGRAFTSEEDGSGSDHVVELSYSLWKSQYHGDPKILGRTIKLDEKAYTVIGVMPPSFHFPYDGKPLSETADLWLPIGFSPDVLKPENRLMEFGVGLIARLKPGVTVQQAQNDIDNVSRHFQQQFPDAYSGNVHVTPHVYLFAAHLVEKTRALLMLLSAAVLCVLLIACANVANLLLARASSRTREMAIRSAVGAARTALLRQCLVESSLLSVLGGCAGVALAIAAVAGLRNYGPASVPPPPRNHSPSPGSAVYPRAVGHCDDSLWLYTGVAAVACRATDVPQGIGADRHFAQQLAAAEFRCHRRNRAGSGSPDRRQLAGSQLCAPAAGSSRL